MVDQTLNKLEVYNEEFKDRIVNYKKQLGDNSEVVAALEMEQHLIQEIVDIRNMCNRVKDLRELTGAGMMDCKKALTACDSNMDKAVDYIRGHSCIIRYINRKPMEE